MRTKYLLLVAGGLAVAALVIWQRSPDKAISIPPAVAEVKAPATEAIVSDAATVGRATDAPTPAPDKDAERAVIRKPAPTRVSRRDPPAAVAGEGTKTAAPPPSTPGTANVPSARLRYERRVTDATRVADTDLEHALLALQQLTTDEPSRPEAYEAMAGIRLRQREYGQARELLGSALRNGGKATFTLIHDHIRGNFEKGDPEATCVGDLTILASEVRFEAAESGDRFAASWVQVRDTGSNKFFGSGIGGFHVTITAEGKMKNFNLAPKSRDKAEGKLILDLLTAYARRP